MQLRLRLPDQEQEQGQANGIALGPLDPGRAVVSRLNLEPILVLRMGRIATGHLSDRDGAVRRTA